MKRSISACVGESRNTTVRGASGSICTRSGLCIVVHECFPNIASLERADLSLVSADCRMQLYKPDQGKSCVIRKSDELAGVQAKEQGELWALREISKRNMHVGFICGQEVASRCKVPKCSNGRLGTLFDLWLWLHFLSHLEDAASTKTLVVRYGRKFGQRGRTRSPWHGAKKVGEYGADTLTIVCVSSIFSFPNKATFLPPFSPTRTQIFLILQCSHRKIFSLSSSATCSRLTQLKRLLALTMLFRRNTRRTM